MSTAVTRPGALSETEQAIADYLKSINVEFWAGHVGTPSKGLGGDRPMDAWCTRFTKGKKSQEFAFYTGLGLRAPATADAKRRAACECPGLTERDKTSDSIYGRKYRATVEALRRPLAPRAASVLHSLILDSSACNQTFDDWCADYGCDTDSRKAFSTYMACQESTTKMRSIFTHAEISHIEELLQDY